MPCEVQQDALQGLGQWRPAMLRCKPFATAELQRLPGFCEVVYVSSSQAKGGPAVNGPRPQHIISIGRERCCFSAIDLGHCT